jgi:N-acetylglucosaminyldiphosphoundecaprenol N-acetyl-beta-D-mannosaminyltransferase
MVQRATEPAVKLSNPLPALAVRASAAPRVVRRRVTVLGSPIDAVSMDEAVQRVVQWGRRRESRVVCICNVHSVVEARRNAALAHAIAGADLATPDGAPVAWMLRRLGVPEQQRVSGPDLMEAACAVAARSGLPIFLFGSTDETLQALDANLRARWPDLRVAGRLAPPFRDLGAEEDADIVRRINESGAGIVWVGLGCPKQERWMAAHRGNVQAVMVGVGAAFDFHAGVRARAPRWMQERGLEWLHRLAAEPRRLARRYVVTNCVFLWTAALQLLRRS